MFRLGCADFMLSRARRAACPSGVFGASSTTCCQAFVAPSRSCFPNAEHDPLVQHGLRVLRVDLERVLELRQRAIGLVRVVVAHPEVGADIRVGGIELERRLVPLDRLIVLLGSRSTGWRAECAAWRSLDRTGRYLRGAWPPAGRTVVWQAPPRPVMTARPPPAGAPPAGAWTAGCRSATRLSARRTCRPRRRRGIRIS